LLTPPFTQFTINLPQCRWMVTYVMFASKVSMPKHIGLMSIALMVFQWAGCEPPAPAAPVAKAATPPVEQRLSDAQIAQFLNGEYVSIVPSRVHDSSRKDLRPGWIVSGRIKSNYSHDLKSVKVRVFAYDKDPKSDTVLDTAEFEVVDVPALGAKAFRQQVQLMVFPNQFRFACTIWSATVKADN
jgi:hypothetical protein